MSDYYSKWLEGLWDDKADEEPPVIAGTPPSAPAATPESSPWGPPQGWIPPFPEAAPAVSDYEDEMAAKEKELEEKYGAWTASLQNVLDTEMPSAPDLSGFYTGMEGLIQQLSAGPGQWSNEALQQAAISMGYQDITNPDGSVTTAWQQLQGDLANMRNATTEDMPGLSDEERTRMQQSAEYAKQGMEEQAQRQLETIMGSRGGMGALAAADEYRRQIADVNLQNALAIDQADYARKVMEIERNDNKYAMMIQSGQASARDYLQMRQQGVMGALQGYMQEASLKMQEYGGQLQAVTTHADLIYKAAMLEIGADESIMNQLSEYWEQMIAPELLQMQRDQLAAEEKAQGDKMFFDAFGLALKAMAVVIGLFTI
jgi:hypothetical protein